ncbi:MAG TPA: hypothetical protein ENI79_01330 [Rhodospirillales bacterium]|nr:hypothetical protein [Rhodospirillales bacterium]
MASNIAKARHFKSVSGVRNVAIDHQDALKKGELVILTPTITEVSTSDLTLSNKVVNTVAITIDNRSVAIGKAVQFKVSGGLAGIEYTINVNVDTDSSPAQTLVTNVRLDVIADSPS